MTPPPYFDVDIQVEVDRFTVEVAFQTTAAFTGLFGPSGAGKTTMLESLAGLRPSARGRAALGGRVLFDSDQGVGVPVHERGIGYVAQADLLFPHLTVLGNVLAGKRRAARKGRDAIDPDRALQVLELTEMRHRRVTTLSGGERQRVALARALCSGPDVLFLDEPLGSLDLPLRRRILPYLLRVRREFGMPMLFVSHDATEVQALCDHLIVLEKGKKIAEGRPGNVLTDPRIFPVAEHLDFENLLRGQVERQDKETAQIVLNTEGEADLRLTAVAKRLQEGQPVMIGVRAEDIILATVRPEGLSARNILPGTIQSIRVGSNDSTVALSLAREMPDILVRLAIPTVHALGLEAGQSVFLVMKARACHVLSEPMS